MSDLWKELQTLGLSESSSKILEHLIRNSKPMSGNEIAQHSKITRYYVFEILRVLSEERRLLEIIPSYPRKYRFDPFSIDRLLRQLNEQIQRLKSPDFDETNIKEFLNLTDEESLLLKTTNGMLTVKKATQLLPHLSPTKIRSVIRSLVRRGLLEAGSDTRPKQYRIFPTSELIKLEKEKQIRQMENGIKRIEVLNQKIRKLSGTASSPEEMGEILLLQGQQILEKVTRILGESQEICLARSTSSFTRSLSDDQLRRIIVELTRATLKAAQRGAKARLILGMELLESYLAIQSEEDLKEILSRFPDLQIRVTDREFPSVDVMILPDTRVFVEYISVIPGLAIYVESKEPAVAKQAYFEELWHSSHEFRLLSRGKLSLDCEKVVEGSLIEFPPYVPFPASEPKESSIFYSYKSAIDAIRAFINEAQSKVTIVFLLDLSDFHRKVITKMIDIWNTITQQALPSITFDIIVNDEMLKLIIPQLKLPENSLATINIRSWTLTGSMGVFILIDEKTFVIPSLERAQEDEWTFLATSNSTMVKQTVRIFKNLWEICQPVHMKNNLPTA